MSPSSLLKDVQVEPSILSADFGRFREQVQEVLDAGARVIHVDIMDGHFVPQLTVGPKVVAALADTVHAVGGLLDVHMMVERPERHVADFIKAGAGSITIHAEATPHLAYAANVIREGGASVGVAINPGTPPSVLSEIADAIDLVLCMTVNPGWGGQAFIERSLGKLERIRAQLGAELPLQVDGGVDADTAPRCRAAGANLFVAGSAIFDWQDPAAAYRAIVASLG
ncbi:MAG TPA: ribulose-phosphate 3-epimerase [Solirubrobacteraceae bacterium]|jgi:ribulose-phosphate 3-epimerase